MTDKNISRISVKRQSHRNKATKACRVEHSYHPDCLLRSSPLSSLLLPSSRSSSATSTNFINELLPCETKMRLSSKRLEGRFLAGHPGIQRGRARFQPSRSFLNHAAPTASRTPAGYSPLNSHEVCRRHSQKQPTNFDRPHD